MPGRALGGGAGHLRPPARASFRHVVPIGPCPAGRFGRDGDCGVARESVYSGRPAPRATASGVRGMHPDRLVEGTT
jgi:hypothetical protein